MKPVPERHYIQLLESPIGMLRVHVHRDAALLGIDFHAQESVAPAHAIEDAQRCRHVTRQLSEYFARKRRDFDLDLRFSGTDFQNAVWRALCDIPYGCTTSYGELARLIGKPSAVRAVGGANGANPIPIVVPCHRVIGASGRLTGFGGGLEVKRALLQLESGERGLFA